MASAKPMEIQENLASTVFNDDARLKKALLQLTAFSPEQLPTNYKPALQSKTVSIEESIASHISKLAEEKSGSTRVAIEQSAYLVGNSNAKGIDPIKSYHQRLYTYAGTACLLLDQLDLPKGTDKEALKNAIFAMVSDEVENTQQAPASYKKAIENYTAKLCQLLIDKKVSYAGKVLDFSTTAKWLIQLEHFYVASLGKPPSQVLRVAESEPAVYHVTEYLPALSEEIKKKYEEVLTEPGPLWFQRLTPPEQLVLKAMVINNHWHKLAFLPSTLDRVPGIRNNRMTRVYVVANGEPKLINTTHASGARVPNGVKGKEERKALSQLNAKAMQALFGDKAIFFANLMTSSILSKPEAKMIIEQKVATEQQFGEKALQANVPVNIMNPMARNAGWKEINRLIANAQLPQEPAVAQLIENLQYLHRQTPLLKGGVITTGLAYLAIRTNSKFLQSLTTVRYGTSLAFAQAYAARLAQLSGLEFSANCKSGKDRTGYVLALAEALAIYQAKYQAIPDMQALNRLPLEQFAMRYFRPVRFQAEERTRQRFARLFAPLYLPHAKAAGNNSPGCDDLKISTIALPRYLRQAIAQYAFVGSGICDMNRPKPRPIITEKSASVFTKLVNMISKFGMGFYNALRGSNGYQQLQDTACQEIEQKSAKPLARLKTVQASKAKSAETYPVLASAPLFVKELNAVLGVEKIGQEAGVVKKVITALATCGLRIEPCAKESAALYHHLNSQPIAVNFGENHTAKQEMARFLHFLAGRKPMGRSGKELAAIASELSAHKDPARPRDAKIASSKSISFLRSLVPDWAKALTRWFKQRLTHTEPTVAASKQVTAPTLQTVSIPFRRNPQNDKAVLTITVNREENNLKLSFDFPQAEQQAVTAATKIIYIDPSEIERLENGDYGYEPKLLIEAPGNKEIKDHLTKDLSIFSHQEPTVQQVLQESSVVIEEANRQIFGRQS